MSPEASSPLSNFAKNCAIGVLAAAAVCVGVFAWLKHQETLALNAQIAAMNADNRQHSGKKSLRSSQDTTETTMDDGTDGSAVGKKGGKKSARADGEQRPKAKERSGWRAYAELAGNPEYEKLSAAQTKAQVGRTYALLFKSLNLAPDAQARLQDLLTQRQQAVSDAVVAARENHIKSKTAPGEFAQDVTQATAPVDAQISQLLGGTAFGQLQQYQNTIPERNLVGQLQQQLLTTPNPLSDDQASRLVDLLAQAKATQSTTGTADTGPGTHSLLAGGGTAKVTPETLTVAQQVLSAPQVQALQEIQQQRAQQSELDKLMKGKVDPSGSPKPPGKK